MEESQRGELIGPGTSHIRRTDGRNNALADKLIIILLLLLLRTLPLRDSGCHGNDSQLTFESHLSLVSPAAAVLFRIFSNC